MMTKIEFTRILRPILKLEGVQTIISEYESVFQEKIKSFGDITEYSRRYNLTHREIEIFISGIGDLSKDSVNISLSCRIERKWFHLFKSPTNDFVTDLKNICIETFYNLSFAKLETSAYTDSYTKSNFRKFCIYL